LNIKIRREPAKVADERFGFRQNVAVSDASTIGILRREIFLSDGGGGAARCGAASQARAYQMIYDKFRTISR
jgi:hypothetical protein